MHSRRFIYKDEYGTEHEVEFSAKAENVEESAQRKFVTEEEKSAIAEIPELKKSVSDGKKEVAAAITDMNVPTEATDTFAIMAGNIRKIKTGVDPSNLTADSLEVIEGLTFIGRQGIPQEGQLPDRPSSSKAVLVRTENNRLYLSFLDGAYREGGLPDGESDVYADFADIRPLVGYINQNHVLEGVTILGAEGKMKNFAGISTWICGYEHSSAQVHPQDSNQALVKGLVNANSGFIEKGTTEIEFNIANAVPKNIRYGVKIGRTEYGNNGANESNTITGEFTGDANISEYDLRNGKIGYSRGNRIVGKMTEKNAATYTPSTVDQKIWGNQYLIGDQTIKGDPNLIAANIKKGVTIFGIVGTWEGYVPTIDDLYLHGNQLIPWIGSSSQGVRFEAGQIYVGSESWIETVNPVNLIGKSQLNIQYYATSTNSSSYTQALVGGGSLGGAHNDTDGEQTATFSLSNAQVNQKIRIKCVNIGNRYIKRIWLS